jgi:hypothetical protein
VSVLGSLGRFLCLLGGRLGSAQNFSDDLVRFTSRLAGRIGCFLREMLSRTGSGSRL